MEANAKKTIHEAIIDAIRDIGGVDWKEPERGAKVNYPYLSEEDLILAVRPALMKNGLSIMPVSMEIVSTEGYQSKNGGNMTRYTIRCKYRLQHTSGDFIELQSLGEGADVGDKGLNKAMTGAYKYCLRQTFLISRGGMDNEQTPSEDQERDERGGRGRGRDDRDNDRGGRGRDDRGNDRGRERKKVDPVEVLDKISKSGSPTEIDGLVSEAFDSLGRSSEFDKVIMEARKACVQAYCGKMTTLNNVRDVDEILGQARKLRTIAESEACQEAIRKAAMTATNRINPPSGGVNL